MSKNYMADVAKMLGVELGEEFDIKGYEYNPYKITDEGLMYRDGNAPFSSLTKLLRGEVEIIKMPWMPKDGERYYSLNRGGEVTAEVFDTYFTSSLVNARMGNYFKTKEEAEANKDRWLEYLKQEPDLSWRVK